MSGNKTSSKNRSNTTKVDVSSKGYARFLFFMWYMTAYEVLLAMGMMDSNPSLAMNFMFSQSLWLVLAVIMSVAKIRWRIQNNVKPHPVLAVKEKLISFRNFLFPFRYKCVADEKHEGLTEGFAGEYAEFWKGQDITKHVTQLLRHQLRLHRGRLESRGIRMEAGWKWVKVKDEPSEKQSGYLDGKLGRRLYTGHVRGGQRYFAGSHKLYETEGVLGADFDSVGARSTGKDVSVQSFFCPNCGATSTGEELTAGCPYCGTAYHMDELNMRICGFSLYRDPFLDRELFGIRLNGHLNRIAAAFSLVEAVAGGAMFMEAAAQDNGWVQAFAVLLLLSTVALIFVAALAFNYLITIPVRLIANKIYKKRQEERSLELQAIQKNLAMSAMIRKSDPDFSLNAFLSNVRNKVASVHFADSAEQMEVFTRVDLSSLVPVYRNVVDCLFGVVKIEDYKSSAPTHTVFVRMQPELLFYEHGKIIPRRENIKLTLCRKIDRQKTDPFSVFSVRCSTCGASIDLTAGNRCTHCGNLWDLSVYDWYISEYESEGIS